MIKVNSVSKIFQQALSTKYDVVIVGGGHAGTEASHAASRMGAKTLLITHKKATIGEMSCNPSFGGVGKGHLMKEVDALGGVCGRICDKAGINYRVLNRSKGPAVWGLRAQIDRSLYKKYLQEEMFRIPNLDIIESSVENLKIIEGKRRSCTGVILKNGDLIKTNNVVLTTGTFLRGSIIIGNDVKPAGRMGDEPAIGLANTLELLDFKLGRLKTGTPPRLIKETIDYSSTIPIKGDQNPLPFSFMNDKVTIDPEDQIPCHLIYTVPEVEDVIRETQHCNHHIREEVKGPRYCPSIESKILRFPGRLQHIFLEPEGLDSNLIYPMGLSCTMPPEYQLKMIRLMPSLRNCEIAFPGYGVEYDFVDPRELNNKLETLKVKGLYFAGQINGTTGYEEAAAQGLIAGVNAAANALNKEALTVDRTEGYIGVLIDDLTTHGTSEPYRMFTSRSEFRWSLRPDNADIRLTEKGYKVGCISDEQFKRYSEIKIKFENALKCLKDDIRLPSTWSQLGLRNKLLKRTSAFTILGFDDTFVTLESLAKIDPKYQEYASDNQINLKLKAEACYFDLMEQQKKVIEGMKIEEALIIPPDFDFFSTDISLSNEMRFKLNEAKPSTIGAASRLPGITPAAIVSLFGILKKNINANC